MKRKLYIKYVIIFLLFFLFKEGRVYGQNTNMPTVYAYFGSNGFNINTPITSGSQDGWADEGRKVDIGITKINGPLNVVPDHCTIDGPPCPTYDKSGNRTPKDTQPNTTKTCIASVYITKVPDAGKTINASFIAKDNGYWTKCSNMKKTSFPQTVTAPFELVGIKITLPNIFKCNNGIAHLSANLYPGGGVGTVEWHTQYGTFTGNPVDVPIPSGSANSIVYAIYKVPNKYNNLPDAEYSDTSIIKVAELTGIHLPHCVGVANGAVPSNSVAKLSFNGSCHPNVTFNPTSITTAIDAQTTNVTVTATDPFNNSFTANTIAVDSLKVLSFDYGVEMSNLLVAIKNGFNKFKNELESVAGKALPCNPTYDFGPFGIKLNIYQMCCGNNVKAGKKLEVYGSGSAGLINCKFMIPSISAPPLYDISFIGGVAVSLGFSVSGESTCQKPKLCLSPSLGIYLSAGFSLGVASGAVTGDIYAQVTGASITTNYCTSPNGVTVSGNINFGEVKVVGSITMLWGLTAKSISYVVLNGYNIPF